MPRPHGRTDPRTADTDADRDAWIGPYRLVRRLGEGGMGIVHLGEGPGGDLVAVKVLRPHIAGDALGRSRLAREVSTLRRVRGPRVAAVLDADVEGDSPYVVTRYVDGPSLDDVVHSEGPLSRASLLRLSYGLADALSTVHAAGVVHRDLKPGNVLLEHGEPVVIDFGIAQVADDSRLTATDLFVGTPGFLAPEIIEGKDATAASDLHSWAATVAYAATGRPPFGRGPVSVVFHNVSRGAPDLDGVPDELEPLLREAMDLDPGLRPTAEQARDRCAALLGRADAWAGGDETVTLPLPLPVAGGRSDSGRSVGADETTQLPRVGATSPRPEDETTQLPRVGSTAAWTSSHAPPTRTFEAPPGPAPTAPAREPGYDQRGYDERGRDPRYGTRVDERVDDRRVAPRDPYGPPSTYAPPPPPAAPGRARPRRWLTLSLWALAAAAGAIAPIATALAIVAGTVLTRTVDRTASGFEWRRLHRGARWSDGLRAVVVAPWHLVAAVVVTALTLPLSLLVVAAVVAPAAFLLTDPGNPLLLGGAVALFALMTWWVAGATVRGGTRRVLNTVAPGRTARAVLALLLVGAAVVCGTLAYQGFLTSWPLSEGFFASWPLADFPAGLLP